MGYLKIHCHNCGNDFELYAHEIERRGRMRCPHCMALLNDKQWMKLQNAFFTIEEVNKGLRTEHEERSEPLLQVEYMSKYIKPDLYCLDEGVREWA